MMQSLDPASNWQRQPMTQLETYQSALLLMALFLQVVQIGLASTEFSSIRLSLAGATLFLLTTVTLLRVSARSYHAGVSLLFALSLLLSWSVSILLLDATPNWNVIGIQLAFPIYLGAMGGHDSRILLRWVTVMSVLTVIYAIAYALTNPVAVIDFVPRAQGFLESRAAHNSAYMIGSIFIFFFIVGVQQRKVPRWLWLPVIIVSAVLLYAYKVRTAQVMVFGFFSILIAPYIRQRFGIAPFLALFFFASLLAVIYVSSDSVRDLTTFSSGRTSVYLERLVLVGQRDLLGIFVGSGPGSDSFYSDTWWWDAKNSHNDFLTALIERGLIGLMLLVWYLFAFSRARSRETIAIVFAIGLTGALSNGLFQRPLPLLFMAFAIWASSQGMANRMSHTNSPY